MEIQRSSLGWIQWSSDARSECCGVVDFATSLRPSFLVLPSWWSRFETLAILLFVRTNCLNLVCSSFQTWVTLCCNSYFVCVLRSPGALSIKLGYSLLSKKKIYLFTVKIEKQSLWLNKYKWLIRFCNIEFLIACNVYEIQYAITVMDTADVSACL
jgi:hypothetical protein